MKSIKYPRKLYKFISWQKDYHKKSITHNEIYFSSIDNFNDPFENVVPIDYSKLSASDWIDIIIELKRSHYGKQNIFISDVQLRAEAISDYLELSKDGRFTDYSRMNQEGYEYRKGYFGIFSLSSTKRNNLLWSHYSNSHKGICIGYDTKSLLNYLKDNYGVDGNEISLYQVNYYRKFPFFDRRKIKDPGEFMLKSLISKSIDWEYEKEFRLISNLSRVNFPINLPDGIICEVNLGARIADGHQKEIIHILREKNLEMKAYKAKISDKRFALEFEIIDY